MERQLAIEKDKIQYRPKEYNVWPVKVGRRVGVIRGYCGCDYKLKM
jgi:hypothetical protein